MPPNPIPLGMDENGNGYFLGRVNQHSAIVYNDYSDLESVRLYAVNKFGQFYSGFEVCIKSYITILI